MGGLGMLSVSFVLPFMCRTTDQQPSTDAIKIMSILLAILVVFYSGLFLLHRKQQQIVRPLAHGLVSGP